MIQVLSTRGTAFLDRKGKFYFVGGGTAGGNAVKARHDDLAELTFLTGILNSFVATFYVSRTGSGFRGDFYAFGKSSLYDLPVPVDSDGAPRNQDVERLVEWLTWLLALPSVNGEDPSRLQDQVMASFFEQLLNALIYELYFPVELHASDLHFFSLVKDAQLPLLNSLPSQKPARVQGLFDLFQKLQAPGHPLRVALDKLQTLDLVRVIEGEV